MEGGGLLVSDPKNRDKTEMMGQGVGAWETPEGIVRALDDSIWFTAGRKLVQLSAGSRKIEVQPGIHLPKERIVALQFDGIGMLWLRTATGLAHVDMRERSLICPAEGGGEANEGE